MPPFGNANEILDSRRNDRLQVVIETSACLWTILFHHELGGFLRDRRTLRSRCSSSQSESAHLRSHSPVSRSFISL